MQTLTFIKLHVCDNVFFHWPTLKSFQTPRSTRITWEMVEKEHKKPNKVNIFSSIVELADSVYLLFLILIT
jgi:hypothetical protein